MYRKFERADVQVPIKLQNRNYDLFADISVNYYSFKTSLPRFIKNKMFKK